MLDNKIDTLTSMRSKLSTQGSNQKKKTLKPMIYQGRQIGQDRNNDYN